MKKIIALLSLALVLFTACEGPQGPSGLDGFNGTDGLIGQVFDKSVSFGSDFTKNIAFPKDFAVNSDVLLVYRLAEINNGVDVWQLMPQNFFLDQGILQYNFDYTEIDVTIFLDANFDLTLLEDKFTQNQIFRIAVVPADLLQGKDINGLEYSEIESMLDANTDKVLF